MSHFRNRTIRTLIAQERKLIQEKTALEIMLKNIKSLRNKLKVEQIQLSTLVQSEMGVDTSQHPCNEIKVDEPTQTENQISIEFDKSNQPSLDLSVDSTNRSLWNKEELIEEEDEEDDDSDDEIVCALDVLGSQTEEDIDFEHF